MPDDYDAAHAAPLLCAGLSGYRVYVLAGAGRRLGLYGFGAAAHLLAQVALAQGREVYAFTRPFNRPGDQCTQRCALSLGVAWAGDSDTDAPVPLDAAIIFAPHGALVPAALTACAKGGTVVCASIRMSAIPAFPYALLWQDRCLRSVAKLTRVDGAAFLALAARLPLRTVVTTFPLAEANRTLAAVRDGAIDGAAVLIPML